MSRRIFSDVEEALFRELRRITFHENRTLSNTVLEETFDPFTGEVVVMPVEPDFYDSSADTGNRNYPHFFVKLITTREDRFTNRVNGAQWGKQFICPNEEITTPQVVNLAYSNVLDLNSGTIISLGDTLNFNTFKVRKIQVGHLLRLLDGNNKGTYTITSITIDPGGNHTLTVSDTLVSSLPAFTFNSTTRAVTFLESAAISTIKVGDVFEDSLANVYNITAVDFSNVTIEIDGSTTPNSNAGSKVTRTGDIFQSTDPDPICFVVLDPTKPLTKNGLQVVAGSKRIDGSIPLDMFYLIRIDSKERQSHIEVINRMWEEFNPPRTALPTIIRTKDSAEELLTEDISTGGSTNVKVKDNSKFKINDSVFIFNNITPTKSSSGGFETPFEANIIDKTGTDTIILDTIVPDTFTIDDCSIIVSNAKFELLMFHFVNHMTKDVEGAQYWVHEFQFWVQASIDRQGEPTVYENNVQYISTPTEDINGIEILGDF